MEELGENPTQQVAACRGWSRAVGGSGGALRKGPLCPLLQPALGPEGPAAHGDGQEAGPLHPAGTHQGRLELRHPGGQGSTTERSSSRRLPPPPLPLSPSEGRGGGTGDPQAPPPACARVGREGMGGQEASRHQTCSTQRRWNPHAGQGGSSSGRRRLPLSNNIGA